MGYTLTELLEGYRAPQIQRALTAILQNPLLTSNSRRVIDHKAVTDLVPAHEWVFKTDDFQLELRQRIEDYTWEIFITGGTLPQEVTVSETWSDDDIISKITFYQTNFHTIDYKPNIETVFDHCKNTFTDITQIYLSARHVRLNDFISTIGGKLDVHITDRKNKSVIHINSTSSQLAVEGAFHTCNISGKIDSIFVLPSCNSTVNITNVTSSTLTFFQQTDEEVVYNLEDSTIENIHTMDIFPSYYTITRTKLKNYSLFSENHHPTDTFTSFIEISSVHDLSLFDFEITYSEANSTGFIKKINMITRKCSLHLKSKEFGSINFSKSLDLFGLDLSKCKIDSIILDRNTIKNLDALQMFETSIGYIDSVSFNSTAFPERKLIAKSEAKKWKQACLYLSDLMKQQSEPDAQLFLRWRAQYYRMLCKNSASEYFYLRIYLLISDFGMSTQRPVWWALGTFVVFAILHYIYTILQFHGGFTFLLPGCIDVETLQRGLWKPLIMGITPQYRAQNIDLVSHVLSLFHLNLSLLFIFLFGFAIRNKIKINTA